jgi:hypothetical protein
MNRKIFILEIVVGLSGLTSVMFFGTKGVAIFALYAIAYFLRKKNPNVTETSEKLMFQKTINITFFVSILMSALLYFVRTFEILGNQQLIINDIWLYLFLSIIMLVHGTVGLIIKKSNNAFN